MTKITYVKKHVRYASLLSEKLFYNVSEVQSLKIWELYYNNKCNDYSIDYCIQKQHFDVSNNLNAIKKLNIKPRTEERSKWLRQLRYRKQKEYKNEYSYGHKANQAKIALLEKLYGKD